MAGAMFQSIMSGVSSIDSILGGFNSLRDQLINGGFGSNPEKKAAVYDDRIGLLEKVPSLSELFKITSPRFMEDPQLKHPAETVKDVIFVNMNKIDNLLFYAFTLGHEMNHVFDNRFFTNKFIEITRFGGEETIPFRNTFGFFKEFMGLSWERSMGSSVVRGENDFKSAEFYYGPNSGFYSQDTINKLSPFVNELVRARMIEYKKQYNLKIK